MMFAWSDGVLTLGAVAAALTAIIGLVVLICRSKPCRWLWSTMVVGPVGAWLRALIDSVVTPKVDELRDEMRAYVKVEDGYHAEEREARSKREHAVNAQFAKIRSELSAIKAHIGL